MLEEQFADILAERALVIARQLGWNWDRTERTDTSVVITLNIAIPHANPVFMSNQVHRLESVLEALGWHLLTAQIGQATAIVQLEYQATPPEPRQGATLTTEQEETEEQPT